MDFKKIARIFIVAFTLLNIYLIYSILERKDIQHTSTPDTTHNILASMEDMDIQLPTLNDTNFEDTKVYSIQTNNDPLLKEKIENNDVYTGTLDEDGIYYTSFPSNPIELKGNPKDGFDKEDYEIIKEYVLSDQVMFGAEFENIQYDAEGKRFLLFQHVDEIPLMDGTSEISLFVNDDGQIYAYQQTYAGPVSRQGDPLELIDDKRAIELLFINNEIREGFEIKKPILTYHRALYLEDISMYSPVWLIDVVHSSEQDTFRVDAVNGTIIRQSAVSKQESQKGKLKEPNKENE